jgi:hypothetical protein
VAHSTHTTRSLVLVSVAAASLGMAFGFVLHPALIGHAQANTRVFEIRTYTTHEGKLGALNARFRDHTTRLFAKHGMTNVGYWTPQDGLTAQNTLIYILAHADREQAKKNWDAFRADPDWQKARSESEAAGPIVAKIDSVFVLATDYSPLR